MSSAITGIEAERGTADSQWLTDLKYRWPARYRASWAALALLMVGVLLIVPRTLSGPSAVLVTALAGALAIASLGQMLVIMLGALDLSISAIMSVSAGIVVHYGVEGSSTPKVIALALAVPVVLSLVNGVMISLLRLNALIVTLATFGIISGATRLWTGVSLSLTGEAPQSLRDWAQGSFLNINACFWFAGLLAVALAAVLSKT